jgi:ribonuclease E
MTQDAPFDPGIPVLTEVLADLPAAMPVHLPPAVPTYAPAQAPIAAAPAVWRTGRARSAAPAPVAEPAAEPVAAPAPAPALDTEPAPGEAPPPGWADLEQRLNERILARLLPVVEQRLAAAMSELAQGLAADLRGGLQDAVAQAVRHELAEQARKQ